MPTIFFNARGNTDTSGYSYLSIWSSIRMAFAQGRPKTKCRIVAIWNHPWHFSCRFFESCGACYLRSSILAWSAANSPTSEPLNMIVSSLPSAMWRWNWFLRWILILACVLIEIDELLKWTNFKSTGIQVDHRYQILFGQSELDVLIYASHNVNLRCRRPTRQY